MTELLEYNDPHSPLNKPSRKLERFITHLGRRKTLNLALLSFAALMLPVALLAVQQQTSIKQRAASSSQVVFVDANNAPITQTTSPTVRVQLTSPYAVTATVGMDHDEMAMGNADYQTVLGSATATYQVGSSTDDLNEINGLLDPAYPSNYQSIWLGGANTSYTGLRFANVNIPKGASVTSARLAVNAATNSWIQMKFQIAAHATGNSPTFSSLSRPSQRVLTANKVNHSSNSLWNANTWYSLNEMNTVIQEIVSRQDWSTGNSISIILKGTGKSYGRKFVKSFDGGAALAPKLLVTYSTPDNVTPTTQPTTVPTATPTPTRVPTATSTPIPPTVTPTSAPVTTQSITLSEDPNFLTNVKTVTPVTTNPTFTDYTFSNTTAGEKLLFAKFTSSTGESQIFSSSITLTQIVVSPTTPPTTGGTNSMAMGRWTPNPKFDTCTKEQHDNYKVKGPDGKWYPTWHPPVDPATGCKFGHEHGRDPKGSTMFAVIQENYGYDENKDGIVSGSELAAAGVPFGYVNEQLDAWNASKGITDGMRHEDHVGHKIEWENNLQRDWSTVNGGSGRVPSGVYCDFFMKMHQGTHSKDAFTNNLHELIQGYQCTDGIRMANAMMLRFGKAGEFSTGGPAGGFITIRVGPATPPNSPSGSGLRAISTVDKVKEHILKPEGQWSLFSEGLYEDWVSGNYVRLPNGTEIAYFDPHFAVFGPSRFFWSSSDTNTYGITRSAQDITDQVGRSIDVCFMNENNGTEKFRGGSCDILTNYGQIKTQIPYDDPRSPFNGVKREFYFNNLSVDSRYVNGVNVWYSDPFGNNAQTTPFPGSVRHFLKPKNDPAPYPYPFESDAIGGGRYYGGDGVHAPN